LESVAGEDGDGFAEDDVAGGLAASQIVVIQRGQVVVDERVGVDHLERGAEFRSARGQCAGDHTGGFDAENGAQPFATREGRVAHRPVDGVRRRGGRRQQPLKRSVGEGCAGGEEGLYVGGHGSKLILREGGWYVR
jgi:hypothetical protein